MFRSSEEAGIKLVTTSCWEVAMKHVKYMFVIGRLHILNDRLDDHIVQPHRGPEPLNVTHQTKAVPIGTTEVYNWDVGGWRIVVCTDSTGAWVGRGLVRGRFR